MKVLFRFAIILFLFSLSGCNFPAAAGAPQVWIDVPVNGVHISVDETISIAGHGTYIADLKRVEISINGVVYQTVDVNPVQGNLYHFEMDWKADSEGDYLIEVTALGTGGVSSPSDQSLVIVGEAAEPDLTLTQTPTQTSTIEYTASATLETSDTTITPSITVSLTNSATVTLTHTTAPTQTVTLTPTFTATTDVTGPPAPYGLSPTGSQAFDCVGSVLLSWEVPSDPAGISGYVLEIQRSNDGSTYSAVSGSPWEINGGPFEFLVTCGWYYRWRIKAVDGLENEGPFSEWAYLLVALT